MTEDTSTNPTIQLNAATNPSIMALQTQIQVMQSGMQAMMNQMQQIQNGGGNNHVGGRNGGRQGGCFQGCGRGRGRGCGRGWGNQNPFIQNSTHNPFLQQNQNPFQQQQQFQQQRQRSCNRYCFTHRMCGHTSNICNNPVHNHNWGMPLPKTRWAAVRQALDRLGRSLFIIS